MANQQTNQTANQQLKNQLDDYKTRISKNRRIKRISFIAGLCLVAVAIVGLVLPAATLEFGKTSCGLEEHTHTEACVNRTVVCALPDTSNGNGHVHTPSCYDELGALACGKTAVAHMHLSNCVDANGKLVCGQEETVHMHTSGCVDPATNTLVCDTADLAHVHGETCYALQNGAYVLVCQEPSVGHVHTALCLDAEGNPVCGIEEAIEINHQHTDACYEEELICGQEEHVHSELCYDEITQSIMKKDEESSAAKAAVEEIEGAEGEAQGDLTAEEIAEARDQGLLFENDDIIVAFEVPDKYKEDIQLTVTETDEEITFTEAIAEAEPEEGDADDASDENADGEEVTFMAATDGEDADDEGSDEASVADYVTTAADVEEAVADVEAEEPAYSFNFHVAATLKDEPVEDIASLGIRARVQVKASVMAPLLNEIDNASVNDEIKDEMGVELTVTQVKDNSEAPSLSDMQSDVVDEFLIQTLSESAPVDIVTPTIVVSASAMANPKFTVQFYALIEQVEMTDKMEDGTKNPVIDTSAKSNGTAMLPQNNKGQAASPTNTNLKDLVLEKDGKSYKVKTKQVITKMYKDEPENNYVEKPNPNYFNKLQENQSYKLDQVWVLKDCPEGQDYQSYLDKANEVAYDNLSECQKYWTIYKGKPNYRFTNRADAATNEIIYIKNGAVIRLVNTTVEMAKESEKMSFFDYDISDGNTTTSNGVQTMNTGLMGINSKENYSDVSSGTVFDNPKTSNYSDGIYAFGNTNTGTGLQNQIWNGNLLNGANIQSIGAQNNGSYEGCTFGLVSGMAANGSVQFSPGVIGQTELFSNGAATGKRSYEGSLTFLQQGDTYTLTSAAIGGDTVVSNPLDRFYNPGKYNGVDHSTVIWTNNFWPLDSVDLAGHDFKFGETATRATREFNGYYKEIKRKDNNVNRPFPASGTFSNSDDDKNHNSYFGMKYEVDFDLAADYVGPLDYLFFGDDDLWIFLSEVNDNETPENKDDDYIVPDSSQLVVDIGGVHSSIGEYVDLWDYLNDGASGKYRLSVFYTERGAAGSTCFMNFTLPSVSFPGNSQSTGSLLVSKTVDGAIDDPNQEFVFNIRFNGADGSVNLDDYAYTRYDSNGKAYTVVDEEGNEYRNDLIVHDDSKFKLKAGEHIVISRLPIGTTFVIEEEDEDDVFLTTSLFSDPSTNPPTLEKGNEHQGQKEISGKITNGDVTVSIEYTNTQPYELPATGGEGTYWYWVGGGLLVLLALVMLWRRQRMASALAISAITPAEASVLALFGDSQFASPSGKPESTYERVGTTSGGMMGKTRKGGR